MFILLFDFDRSSKIAANVYDENNPYSLEDCLFVFKCYFENYEKYRGQPHPPIKANQVSRLMWTMPFRPPIFRREIPDIFPAIYPYLIQLHFKTRYRNCDYNINHFFSGEIREMRWHEADKGYEWETVYHERLFPDHGPGIGRKDHWPWRRWCWGIAYSETMKRSDIMSHYKTCPLCGAHLEEDIHGEIWGFNWKAFW